MVEYNNKYFLKLNKIIRKVNIQYRLLIAFMVISLVPLSFLAFFSQNYTSKTLTSKISDSSVQLLIQIDRIMQEQLSDYENIGNSLMVNKTIQKGLLTFDSSDYIKQYGIIRDIYENTIKKNVSSLFLDINIIALHTKKDEIFYDFGYDKIKDDDRKNIMKRVDNNDGLDIWSFIETQRGVDSIIFSRRINDVSDFSNVLGYMFLTIDERSFMKEIYYNVDMGKGSKIFILDKNGQVMSSNNSTIEKGKQYPEQNFMKILKNKHKEKVNSYTAIVNNEKQLVVFKYNSYADWYLVATIPYSYISEDADRFEKSIIVIMLICIIAALIFTFIIFISIMTPLKEMIHCTSHIKDGNFDIRIEDDSKDELGYLSSVFNNDIEKIKELIELIKDEQYKKRKIEIKMLQAQINPHFLFNALNSLKWTAVMSRATSVSEGLGSLSEILRNSIIVEEEYITLAEEIKNIDNYVVIEKLRYGDIFSIEYEIEDIFLNNKILKFLLQPIIENSIIHGFDNIDYEGIITISVKREKEKLIINVCDNGKGYDVNRINEEEKYKKKKFSSIGIKNIRERIELNYGNEYSLSINSSIKNGTTVTIEIPYDIGGGIFDE